MCGMETNVDIRFPFQTAPRRHDDDDCARDGVISTYEQEREASVQ